MDFSILDKPIRIIREAVRGIAADDAKALLAAEEDGKTRKGVVDLLKEVLAEEPAPDPCLIRNHRPGVTLHLGDGRKLAFGEQAEVSPELAALLRERGQAE